MKNIPRIYIGDKIRAGDTIVAPREVMHYLTRVMRTDSCLVFGGGHEYNATLTPDNKFLSIGSMTNHTDPSNDITLLFSPIRRTDDLLNMATQMGVAYFQPVITQRTNTHNINWTRMQKIIVEASEQSNRNSIPVILPEKKFSDIDLSGVCFADERCAHGGACGAHGGGHKSVLIGPEGGFSESEFATLDANGAVGISLGRTILRAELAGVIAISKILGDM